MAFTGDEFADGGDFIANTLHQQRIKASFFLTGRFYENSRFKKLIARLKQQGNYLGPHSFDHLLYCDWNKRDSLLVTEQQFSLDLLRNLEVMDHHGIEPDSAKFFIPPFEWYNQTISEWTQKLGIQLVNFTSGTKSTADYTTPDMKNYRSNKLIWQSIIDYEKNNVAGLNGFILLLHIGTDPGRSDKFYKLLPQLIALLKQKGYRFVKVDELLKE